MHSTARPFAVIIVSLVFSMGACRALPDATSQDTSSAAKAVADSQYTAAAMIAKFRTSVPNHPEKFGGDAAVNRDSLITHYAHALDTKDTAAFSAMRISVSEYAWLYYLEMPQAKPPYELDPDVLWMQITSQSNKGLGRLSDRVGSAGFGFKSATCDAPQKLGAVTLHHCQMTGREFTVPVSIIERDGLFKFTSYANQL